MSGLWLPSHIKPPIPIKLPLQVTGTRRTVLRPAYSAASREGLQHGLSGEALSMFHDAQRNILELNKSRLMALDELKQAKERINELGALCLVSYLPVNLRRGVSLTGQSPTLGHPPVSV